MNKKHQTGLEIAIIGMSCRFPGARSIEEYWKNIENGVESITFYSPEELEAAGVPRQQVEHPNYVPAVGEMPDMYGFDAAFFGYTPVEAIVMDPQQRKYQEIVWEALEHAGYVPDDTGRLTGNYTGAGANFYWEANTRLGGISEQVGDFEAVLLNNKDFLSTRISYKFNLTGPSVTIHTACSTSLVAVHQAVRGLLTGECDMALAGGVTQVFPDNKGYVYQEGMISSPDGHNRTFDAESGGTVFGNGAGVVVLKRLADAQRDRDTVHAVIKATAVNNDGRRKVGYTAPSTEGQAEVIKRAMSIGKIPPESITYVELHGTATRMGDTMEAEALKRAFKAPGKTIPENTIALGSVKTNIGHLDTAAGVAGLIKTALALKHKLIPASLHFKTINPNIQLTGTPFYVNSRTRKWNTPVEPRRAGVSAFGIGGTNAHVILEEAPEETENHTNNDQRDELLLLSARTETALETMTENLTRHLRDNPTIRLQDLAYTLAVGRKMFKHRRTMVSGGTSSKTGTAMENTLMHLQSEPESGHYHTAQAAGNRPVVFMFAGLGSQYVDMAREIYRNEPVFRKEMDDGFELLRAINPVGIDLNKLLYPETATGEEQRILNRVEEAQQVIFLLETALAAQLIHWGIEPDAMMGYSFGEYAAAQVAGVLTKEDALKLIVARGRLIAGRTGGAMLSVPQPQEEVGPYLEMFPGLSVAIDNGPSVIVAGPADQVNKLENHLKNQRIMAMRLTTEHAVHSQMMENIRREFEQTVSGIPLNPPRIPYISNVTGRNIRDEEAVEPQYWGRHLRETVRFADGVRYCVEEMGPDALYIEIGPGRDLMALIARYIGTGDSSEKNEPKRNDNRKAVNLLPAHGENLSSHRYILNKVGTIWRYGRDVDWKAFYEGRNCRRIPLPTTPFEQREFRPEGNLNAAAAAVRPAAGTRARRLPDPAERFCFPTWNPTLPPQLGESPNHRKAICLIFRDRGKWAEQLGLKQHQMGYTVISVEQGNRFQREAMDRYTINPQNPDDYDALFDDLLKNRLRPHHIQHYWNVGEDGNGYETFQQRFESTQNLGYYSIIRILQALQRVGGIDEHRLTVVTTGAQDVGGEGVKNPEKTTLLGLMKVIPQEHPVITCQTVDIDTSGIVPQSPRGRQIQELLLREIAQSSRCAAEEPEIAYRKNRRWARNYRPVRLEAVNREKKTRLPFKKNGVYVITGGRGGMGMTIAGYLAEAYGANLILVGRAPVPNDDEHPDVQKIRRLEQKGADVYVASADVADTGRMQEVIGEAEKRFGTIDGIIHAAGVTGGTSIRAAVQLTETDIQQQFRAKIYGQQVLEDIFRDKPLDLFVVMSSIATVLGGIAFAAYSAANQYLDARAGWHEDTPQITVINWDTWIFDENIIRNGIPDTELAMTPEEGLDAFLRIMAAGHIPRIVHTLGDLQVRIDQWIKLETLRREIADSSDNTTKNLQPRPDQVTPYEEPVTGTEKKIAAIWGKMFGYEKVGRNDNFFDLGGDSLKVLTVSAKIHKELDVEIGVQDFFKNPTVQGVAGYAEKTGTTGYRQITPSEELDYYPLTPAQKRLYIIQQIEKDSVGYNEAMVYQLPGRVQEEKLDQVFQRLIRRHESFRTGFLVHDDHAVQRVYPMEEIDFRVEVAELNTDSPGNLEARVSEELAEFSRPFDLSNPPLLRVKLIKAGPTSILAAEMHHIISDGHSYQVFFQEFSAFYNGVTELPGHTLHYRDYALWHNKPQQQQAMKRQEEFWLNRFDGEIPVLMLPTDFPRPEIKSFEGDAVHFYLDKEETAALRKMVREEDVTLYMLLLTIFNVQMHKLSRQEDIVVGTPVHGRNREELKHIIGMFVNTLALRSQPGGDKTFREYLHEIREITLEAFANQDYPFEELTDKRAGKRDAGRNPMFDVLFTLQNVERRPLDMIEGEIGGTGTGFEVTPYDHQLQQAQFDLLMFATEAGDYIDVKLVYAMKLFKRETMERHCGYYKDILAEVLKNPSILLADIKIGHHLEKAELFIPETDFDF
jgi:polyketide synthase PksJ